MIDTHPLVLATRNKHKVAELADILLSAGLAIDLVAMDAFPDVAEVAETGSTFAENAMLKAVAVAEATGIPAVADDSGLCVDALNGMPGVLSARWSGRHGDDAANLRLVLDQIADVPDGRRGARFVCAAAVAVPGKDGRVVEGTLEGTLIREPRGSGGFGYDPIFLPLGAERTTAQVSSAEKNAISHRGRAFRALTPVLIELGIASPGE